MVFIVHNWKMGISRRDFLKLGGLGLLIVALYSIASQFRKSTPKIKSLETLVNAKTLETLAIYYGWPTGVNNSLGSITNALEKYSNFDNLVLGAGLEFPSHQEHENTKRIISGLKNTNVFGYVNLGYSRISDHSLDQLALRIEAWSGMGAEGIFFDEVSPAYKVDYDRLGYALNKCREKNINVFINSDSPEWIKKSDLLRRGDSVLIESFAYSFGKKVSDSNPYIGWADSRGIKVFGVATCDTTDPIVVNRIVKVAQNAARTASLDGLAITDPMYSASGTQANYLLIP